MLVLLAGGAVEVGGGGTAVGGNSGKCGLGRQEFIFNLGGAASKKGLFLATVLSSAFARSYHCKPIHFLLVSLAQKVWEHSLLKIAKDTANASSRLDT